MTPAARSRLIFIAVATGVLLIFFHALGVLRGAEAAVMRGLAPIETVLSGAGRSLKRWVGAPFSVSAIMQENEAVKNERDGLLVQIAQLREKEDENARLREILKFPARQPGRIAVAHVLASAPEAGTHTILLDKGSDDGLLLDMPVMVGDGIIVGKIFKLDKASSLALLLTDTRSRVGAMIHDAAKTQGVVQGKRGLSVEMRLIPQNEVINEGDLVVTSGIEPLVPRGLVIGRVQGIETQERDPFKTATIRPPTSLDDIEVVAIPLP
jgi:rod shape-determining protein MreC